MKVKESVVDQPTVCGLVCSYSMTPSLTWGQVNNAHITVYVHIHTALRTLVVPCSARRWKRPAWSCRAGVAVIGRVWEERRP